MSLAKRILLTGPLYGYDAGQLDRSVASRNIHGSGRLSYVFRVIGCQPFSNVEWRCEWSNGFHLRINLKTLSYYFVYIIYLDVGASFKENKLFYQENLLFYNNQMRKCLLKSFESIF